MALLHIPLTIDGRRVLVPAAATLFEEVDSHVVVHFGGEAFNVDETFEQVVAALAVPTVQDLCAPLIKASREAISSLQHAVDLRGKMPVGELVRTLTSAGTALTAALQQMEQR